MARDSGVTRRIGSGIARRAFSFRALGEIIGELRRVTWPTKEETFRLSIMVICVSAAVGAFLGVIDIGFSRLMGSILGN